MEKLSEKNWMPTKVTDVFHLVRVRASNMAALSNGKVPLISAKHGSNGVKGFVSTSNKLIKGSCITLNNDGDGGAGLAYYQPIDMALDTHVTALVPKQKICRYSMLFISRCLSGLHGFFGHGLSISNTRAQKIKVMLSSIDGIRLLDGADKSLPYVTRTDLNHGITKFVSKENLSSGYDNGGCTTVGLDTQTAFWQNTRFVTGQNIQIITGERLNLYIASF